MWTELECTELQWLEGQMWTYVQLNSGRREHAMFSWAVILVALRRRDIGHHHCTADELRRWDRGRGEWRGSMRTGRKNGGQRRKSCQESANKRIEVDEETRKNWNYAAFSWNTTTALDKHELYTVSSSHRKPPGTPGESLASCIKPINICLSCASLRPIHGETSAHWWCVGAPAHIGWR